MAPLGALRKSGTVERSARRGGGRRPVAAAAIMLCCAVLLATLALLAGPVPPALADDELQLQDVMDGDVPGLTAVVNGTNGAYYGDCLRVTFKNDTTDTLRVRVPIGLRLAPANAAVQRMLTVGGEVIVVPPGGSVAPIKAFCGQEHNHAPGGGDSFWPDGFVDDDLMQTLREINRRGAFDSDGQHAVWHLTDGRSLLDDPRAQDFLKEGGPSAGEAAAAGTAAAIAAALLSWLLGLTGDGSALSGGGDGGGPEPWELDDEEFEGWLEESPPPPPPEPPPPPPEPPPPPPEEGPGGKKPDEEQPPVPPPGEVPGGKKPDEEQPPKTAEEGGKKPEGEGEKKGEAEGKPGEKQPPKPDEEPPISVPLGDTGLTMKWDPFTQKWVLQGGGWSVTEQHDFVGVWQAPSVMTAKASLSSAA